MFAHRQSRALALAQSENSGQNGLDRMSFRYLQSPFPPSFSNSQNELQQGAAVRACESLQGAAGSQGESRQVKMRAARSPCRIASFNFLPPSFLPSFLPPPPPSFFTKSARRGNNFIYYAKRQAAADKTCLLICNVQVASNFGTSPRSRTIAARIQFFVREG